MFIVGKSKAAGAIFSWILFSNYFFFLKIINFRRILISNLDYICRCDSGNQMLSMHGGTNASHGQSNAAIMPEIFWKRRIWSRLPVFNYVHEKDLSISIAGWENCRNRQPKLCKPKIYRAGKLIAGIYSLVGRQNFNVEIYFSN